MGRVVLSGTAPAGCRACRQLADTAGHEPYLPRGVPPTPPQGDPYAGREVVDEALSAAVVAYLSYGSTPFPWADEQAVAALHVDRDPAELVERVRAIDAEMTGYEVDWDRHGYQGGCAEAAATLRARHPELGPQALAALDWAFSYRWR
ncbi:hypothetical protein [Cellulomonas sp. Y8]|uniref:hypothetical protein n=1 Tax=Cellulomonas sp. Y8 TaxID=2591145 RepID=UPI0011C9D445|nr:hypothetical protein [Cellulomonas sp. Y8]